MYLLRTVQAENDAMTKRHGFDILRLHMVRARAAETAAALGTLERYLEEANIPAPDIGQRFDALRRESCIAVEDALSDPRTRDLVQPYLVPQGVHALLDAIEVEHEIQRRDAGDGEVDADRERAGRREVADGDAEE